MIKHYIRKPMSRECLESVSIRLADLIDLVDALEQRVGELDGKMLIRNSGPDGYEFEAVPKV